MKYWQIILISSALSASSAFGDDFKTIDGKEYKDVTVKRVEPDGLVLSTKSGVSKVYFTELPQGVQQRFNYDAGKAAAYSAEQTAAFQDLRNQQEKDLRQQAEAMRKSNEQLARNRATMQKITEQRENVQALQLHYEALQLQENNLLTRIREAERLPDYLHGQSGTKYYSYKNPARQNLPAWYQSLSDVRREKSEVKRQLEQARH